MIRLYHVTKFVNLAPIHAAGGLCIGRVPLSLNNWREGCTWLMSNDPRQGRYEPTISCIAIDLPQSCLGKTLFCWKDHLRLRTRKFREVHDFQNNATIYYSTAKVPCSQFAGVFDLEGVEIQPEEF